MTANNIIEWLIVGCAVCAFSVALMFGAQIIYHVIRGNLDITDWVRDRNGGFNQAKTLTLLAKCVLLFAMVKDATDGSPSWELQSALAAVIMGHEVLKLSQRLKFENPRHDRRASDNSDRVERRE